MEKTPERRKLLQCKIYPFDTIKDYKFVVVCSYYHGKWLLSRHKERNTWETQGGHIEAGETPLEAAQRELFEESGVTDASLYPLCDYYGYDAFGHANGAVFLAVIHQPASLPESEMAETRLFTHLPNELTYPMVTPVFFREAIIALEKQFNQ